MTTFRLENHVFGRTSVVVDFEAANGTFLSIGDYPIEKVDRDHPLLLGLCRREEIRIIAEHPDLDEMIIRVSEVRRDNLFSEDFAFAKLWSQGRRSNDLSAGLGYHMGMVAFFNELTQDDVPLIRVDNAEQVRDRDIRLRH